MFEFAKRITQTMGRILFFAAIALACAVFVPRIADRSSQSVPAAAAMAVAPGTNTSRELTNSRMVTLPRGDGGHFWTEAKIDGRRLQFVVDTGASHIALRASDAARLGIHPTAREYSVKVSTANGITRAALVELRSVEVADLVVRNVTALVQPDEALGVNLLGMSFLSRIRWTHERGKLVLEQ
jgi:aspartyl protease family protein